MNFKFTQEQETLRKEFREFFEKETSPDLLAQQIEEQDCVNPFSEELFKKIAERGWLGLMFPEEWGGLGKGHLEHFIFMEELERSGTVSWAMMDSVSITVNVFGHQLLNYGTEEQKKTWIPKILKGEVRIVVGLTEPNAGSDLAALESKAEEEGDYFILNGSKIFNAGWLCTHIFTLVKTDWKIVPKHKGMSYFLVPLDTPGVTVDSNLMTHGKCRRSVVTYENVKVPKANMMGKMNDGFYMAMRGFAFERLQFVGGAKVVHMFNELIDFVKKTQWDGKLLADVPDIRYKLADIATEIEIGRLLSFKGAWQVDYREPSLIDSSLSWLNGNEAFDRISNAMMDILGEYGLLESWGKEKKWVPLRGKVAMGWLDSRALTVGGGTSEIIRNAIAGRLGLPRN